MIKLKDILKEAETNIAGQTKPFQPGDMWSNDFDYIGMLKFGANLKIPSGGSMWILKKKRFNEDILKPLYESFTDVNYHREAQDLGNAIDWIEDAKGIEDIERAHEFLEMFKKACLKTLKDIERK